MEIKIVWTKRAEKGLSKTLDYLEKEWTKKEIQRLELNINDFIERIRLQPEIYPTTPNINIFTKEWWTKIITSFIKYMLRKSKLQSLILGMQNEIQFTD